jgi:hypothetical protein
MAKRKGKVTGAPKYPAKDNGTPSALNTALKKAATPTVSKHFSRDGMNPVERGGFNDSK